jgi:hypothetical protein
MAPKRGPQATATIITNPASVAVMNEQQPYEKRLAEKMQHLPPPADINESWEEMRSLLEKEMPRGGGGGMPGGKRWWALGIAIGILFLATWLSGEHARDKKAPGAEIAGTARQPAVEANKAALPGNTDGPATAPSGIAKEGEAATGTPDQPVASAPAVNDNSPEKSRGEPVLPDKEAASHPERTVKKNNNNDHLKPVDEAIITPESKRTNSKKNSIKTGRANNKTIIPFRNGSVNGNAPSHHRPLRELANGKTSPGSANRKGQKELTNKNGKQTGNELADSKPSEDRVRSSNVKAPPRYIDTKPEPALHPGPQILRDYAVRSGLLPQRPAANTSTAQKKVTKRREAGTFAAGFSLPLAFPLGDQRAMGYNFRGGHNTISDYLPSPHLQYHLNGNTFLQTEVQFISPQFIPSVLLYNSMSPMSGGYYTSTSIFARKLYYFNLPVSIHYSPFPGFYLGSGLQFSSLISGIALTEERKWTQGGGTVYLKDVYSRFSRDTLSDKINGNEFRLLLDANYYWSKFTVGLRYNQALSNYISFQVSPSMPYSFSRNRALQFYLRYNLWEEKKKPNNGKTLLTFK